MDAPGPVAAVVLGVEVLAVELLLDFELLPHAASSAPASTVAITVTARVRTPLNLVDLLPSIRRLSATIMGLDPTSGPSPTFAAAPVVTVHRNSKLTSLVTLPIIRSSKT